MSNAISVGRMLQLRTAFITYNISRLRELIRYLPKKKFELFQNIPLWIHVNLTKVPGYVDSPQTPCGIYRFHGSGFWRQASQRHKLFPLKKTFTRCAQNDVIIGLYLMGSSGTLAQTDKSDFDYWLVIDDEGATAERMALFQKKLDRIKIWSKERYDQEVGFFVLSLSDIRDNRFAAVDEESSGSAQRTFLKEEFYRTFIMIAGKIPYWAVVPANISDIEYDQWIQCARQSRSLKFMPEDYADLGNLETISPEECLGALLWQMFKARKYPAKSLIKAALIAHSYFFSRKNGLLCDRIKAQFGGNGCGDQGIDPYAVVFETAIDLFQALDDVEGLVLIRECVFLKLSEPSRFDGREKNSPKLRFLAQYQAEWAWDKDQTDRLTRFHDWPESNRLAFEERVFNKIGFLYNLILRAHDGTTSTLSMAPSDLITLKNRISAAITKKPGKLHRCSAYLQSRLGGLVFQVSGYLNDRGQEAWSVYHHVGELRHARHVVFSASELLRVIGWLLANGFYSLMGCLLEYQTYQLPISPQRIKRLADDVYRFFCSAPVSPAAMLSIPQWEKIGILLHPLADGSEGRLSGADFLAVNSWGEFFFESIALAHIDEAGAICYKISEFLWNFYKGTEGGKPFHQVFQMRGNLDIRFLHRIESGLAVFRDRDIGSLRQGTAFSKPESEENDAPWLDLL
ncbi:MAG: class I adenylate cyclase [Desulfobacterales bacterium]|jgi:adenylate cyclase class 1|nr:class I adenylate cyclase [Desulfobacterales bacterium]